MSRLNDPPRIPAHDDLLARLRATKGARMVQLLVKERIDVNAVLAAEEYIEPNHLNDSSPEWRYYLTTAFVEAYRADDVAAVEALLDSGALATRYVTLHDHSTATFMHTYVEHRVPQDAWTYRDLGSRDARAAAPRLERAFHREVDAALRGELGSDADRNRALVCALFHAIDRRDRMAVARALAAGADATLGGPGGTTAIGLALVRDDLDTAALLLAHPDALTQVCAWTLPGLGSPLDLYPILPLHAAAALGNTRAVRFLLERGADPAQGFPDHHALHFHLYQHKYGTPVRACMDALAKPMVTRLRETIGEAAMVEELEKGWRTDVLEYLRAAGLVP